MKKDLLFLRLNFLNVKLTENKINRLPINLNKTKCIIIQLHYQSKAR